jgi:2-polyprenyl-3-methyl-5-hydroxy-6-metoxy-1,4-benzoquinol methylase
MFENNIWMCPKCGDTHFTPALSTEIKALCVACGQDFECDQNIPLLFYPHQKMISENGNEDVTEKMKRFYEATPFPNYDGIDSIWTLKQKAKQSVIFSMLDEQIPPNASILEAGCGTGQLSNFLGAQSARSIFGADLCVNSLKLAETFRSKNKLKNVKFVQMNLFKPVFKPNSFDLVISNGVLHHTSDPYGGFKSIAQLVKPGGYIIIGLYNYYGRLLTDLRRLIFNLTKDKFLFLDARMRNKSIGDYKKEVWFKDQYKNPHESKHTMTEVIHWMEGNGFEFINGIPKVTAFDSIQVGENLFRKHFRGTKLDHLIAQLSMLTHEAKEGAIFLIIGRKQLER